MTQEHDYSARRVTPRFIRIRNGEGYHSHGHEVAVCVACDEFIGDGDYVLLLPGDTEPTFHKVCEFGPQGLLGLSSLKRDADPQSPTVKIDREEFAEYVLGKTLGICRALHTDFYELVLGHDPEAGRMWMPRDPKTGELRFY